MCGAVERDAAAPAKRMKRLRCEKRFGGCDRSRIDEQRRVYSLRDRPRTGLRETMSRKSVDMLEEKSAVITATEAKARHLETPICCCRVGHAGWILFQEGKLEDASLYRGKRGRDSLHAEVAAIHLVRSRRRCRKR